MSIVASRVRFELISWSSLALCIALLEGGVVGVLIKNGFSQTVEPWLLNLCVAIATGAPFYSNLISFIWVKMSHGKNKAKVVSNLALLCCIATIAMSLVSFNGIGLVLLIGFYVLARICWSGILTTRSAIWRDNYPRHIRGKVTAKLATLSAFLMSLTTIFTGWLLDWQFEAFKYLYAAVGLLSLIGAWRYRKLSIRHHQKRLDTEKQDLNKISVIKMFRLLTENTAFGKYMLAMFALGSGNLMFMAPLIVFLNEHTELSKIHQILITTAIPLAMVPIAVGYWAKLLDQNHVFRFRAIHSWGFVSALVCFSIAQIVNFWPLFYLGAFIYGFALAGGVIGWNLGHNDFVGNARPMDYMAVHVTLTGLRGLLTPIIGITFYQWLESIEIGLGQYALLLPLTITTIGGSLFVIFNKQRVNSRL